MINSSSGSSVQQNQTTMVFHKACEAPSTENSSVSSKVGNSSNADHCDGSRPSSVPINERAVQPLTASNIRIIAAKVKEKVKEDLQKLKEKLIICDPQIDDFEKDYTQILLWQARILESFPKGMLLSSRPGLGKTVFMQAAGNMIVGKDKDCIQFLRGADLLKGGHNKIFSDARSYYEKSLKASESRRKCFVYCIDEIDTAFMKKRHDIASADQDACRNAIQSIMDGGTELSIPPIYIFGTTNIESSKFHPALIRSGRFGNHVSFDKRSSEVIQKLIKLYLKSHSTINVEDKNIPLLSALYDGKSPAEIKDQIDKIAASSINEGFFIIQEDDEQTTEKCNVPFNAFKNMLYPPWQTNKNFNREVKQLKRLFPYFHDLPYSSRQMKEALSLMTDIAHRQEVGAYSIILLQGKAGSGKTAFLHELLQQFKAEDKEYLVDHYSVIRYAKPCPEIDWNTNTVVNVSSESTEAMCRAKNSHYRSVIVIDGGDWLVDRLFLPTTGSGCFQYDPSIFLHEWNKTENSNKKNNVILLVAFNSEAVLQKLNLQPNDKVTANEFKNTTGLGGVIEGIIKLPEYIDDADVEQLLGKFAVDDAGEMTKTLENERLSIKKLMSLIFSSKSRNGTIDSGRFKNLLKLNRKYDPNRPVFYS